MAYVYLAKYIHSKNAFKTVLGRLEAEINSFLCFDWSLCVLAMFWSVIYATSVRKNVVKSDTENNKF